MTRRRPKPATYGNGEPWPEVITPPTPPRPAPCKVHEPVKSVEWHIRTAKNDPKRDGMYTVVRCAVCGVHLAGGAL